MVNLYHVAHHSIMPVSVWWGVKFLAGENESADENRKFAQKICHQAGIRPSSGSSTRRFTSSSTRTLCWSRFSLNRGSFSYGGKLFIRFSKWVEVSWKLLKGWAENFFFKIGQFAMIFLHAFQLVWNNDCNYPIAFVYFIGGHAVLFYLLVSNKMASKQFPLLNRC